MKKILTFLLVAFSIVLNAQSPYLNEGDYIDTITITKQCRLYKTPSVDMKSDLLIIPSGEKLMSNYFNGCFYRVVYNDCPGYVFCLNVQESGRITRLRECILRGDYIENHMIINCQYENDGLYDQYFQSTYNCDAREINRLIESEIKTQEYILEMEKFYYIQLFVEIFTF
jgi:hypothetical protein